MNQISPKIFEAAALRTALVLFPGEYSGILRPWTHYIPLMKDFSNMREVAERVRDTDFLRTLTDKAYRDLIASGTYSCASFVTQFDGALTAMSSTARRRRKTRYHAARIRRAVSLLGVRAKAAWNVPAAAAKAAIILQLMIRTEGGRRLIGHVFRQGLARGLQGFRPLCGDLLRLAVVARAQTGAVAGNTPFTISNRFDAERGLMFVSRPCVSRPGETSAETDVHPTGALRESIVGSSGLRQIVWDHSLVTGEVRYPVTRSRSLSIEVAAEYDVYRFTALEDLARRFPGPVYELLRAAIEGGSRSQPDVEARGGL